MTSASPVAASSTRTALRTARPLITVGATWVVRKGMMKAYEARTGRPAPVIYSREASMLSKVLWAATMAATIAAIEIIVWQILDADDD
ncbi:MAG: hypothetical protein MUF09_05445 [Candidatus Nanopelagicales bacterium]|jgi:hypothetical protein|nr:hypothetical protein [Candidatus Nanopelagicales bacterium]